MTHNAHQRVSENRNGRLWLRYFCFCSLIDSDGQRFNSKRCIFHKSIHTGSGMFTRAVGFRGVVPSVNRIIHRGLINVGENVFIVDLYFEHIFASVSSPFGGFTILSFA